MGGHYLCTACWNKKCHTMPGTTSLFRLRVSPSASPANANVEAFNGRARFPGIRLRIKPAQ